MRILLVSPGNNRKFGGGFFYAFHRRMINGFIRSGYFVYAYSDRDTADSVLGIRSLGKRLANRRLVEIAREMQPDLLILLQSHLIEADTIRQIRGLVPGLRVGAISIDDIDHPRPAGQFYGMLEEADFGFATTGGATLASFSDTKTLAYIPNPVDVSVDNHIAYEAKVSEIDVVFACDQPDTAARWVFAERVKEILGSRCRVEYFGRRRGRPLRGDTYVRTLGLSRIGLNLNSRQGELYASDRMAQLLGNGLLLASYRSSGFGTYFSDDEMLFFSDAESLAEQIIRVLDGDQRWREMAKAGRAKALKIMNEVLVARFIVAIMAGQDIPSEWVFGDHVFNHVPASKPRAVS